MFSSLNTSPSLFNISSSSPFSGAASSSTFGGTTTYSDSLGRTVGSSSTFGGITSHSDAIGRPVGSRSRSQKSSFSVKQKISSFFSPKKNMAPPLVPSIFPDSSTSTMENNPSEKEAPKGGCCIIF